MASGLCGNCITEGPTLLVDRVFTKKRQFNMGPIDLCAVCLYTLRTTGDLPDVSLRGTPFGRGAYKPTLDELDNGWGKWGKR